MRTYCSIGNCSVLCGGLNGKGIKKYTHTHTHTHTADPLYYIVETNTTV